MSKITINFAWDIWCIGAFWFGLGKQKRLNIFPFPFCAIQIDLSDNEESE